jgi:hypothetical protein
MIDNYFDLIRYGAHRMAHAATHNSNIFLLQNPYPHYIYSKATKYEIQALRPYRLAGFRDRVWNVGIGGLDGI